MAQISSPTENQGVLMLSRLLSRDAIAGFLEAAILRVETRKFMFGPAGKLYQPLPWLGIQEARRSAGTIDRMAAIRSALGSPDGTGRVALDVGCNTGFFSLSLMEAGYFVYGVDSQERNLRIAAAVSRRIAGSGSFSPIRMLCDTVTVTHLPSADVVLTLSIWHHWVKHFGLDAATSILRSLWDRTREELFFDSGEAEMPETYRLPFGNSTPAAWLRDYLAQVCVHGSVTELGRFAAAAPVDSQLEGPITRSLFVVKRVDAHA